MESTHLLKSFKRIVKNIINLNSRLQKIQEALGRIEQRQVYQQSGGINDSEFRVFSQWGEDGIIQFLIRNVPIERNVFIEFGVENYTESNTRFLVINNYWSGLVLDGSLENINYIKKDVIYWGYNIKAEHAFITKENINDLITRNGIKGDIGILSIDIDGNDYWVWEAINCVTPRIVICEYNSLFGKKAKVTTPYKADFTRDVAHFSKIYYGSSIAALNELAVIKGYSLVGSNMAGNNIFFVRNDLVGKLKVYTPETAYRQLQFRECHNENGELTFDDFETRLNKIKELELYNIETRRVMKIKDIKEIIA